MSPGEIDWTKFDGLPESNCECACVYETLEDGDEVPTFRSHVKFVRDQGLVSRKPCPRCGRHDQLCSVHGDWETV